MKHKSSTVYAAGSAVARSGREGRTRLNTHRPGENEDNRQRKSDLKETDCRRVRL